MTLDTVVSIAIEIVVIVILAALGLLAIRFISQRILRLAQSRDGVPESRRRQLQTLVQVIRWAMHVLLVTIAFLMLLSRFVDITPLLASVGVVGLALSLGTQALIKDFISGVLILLEGQYTVGDVIKVGAVSGTVERLTLRTTHVRDINGSLHFVPNGEVRIVSNVTRDWSRALVDIGVAYEEDLDRVFAVLEDTIEAFAADPDVAPQLLERPQVLGPLALGDWAVTVRVMVKTLPGKQWGVALGLRKRILRACERTGITLPYPRQEILLRPAEPA
jgi:moderate conductance mechanosensitive channel